MRIEVPSMAPSDFAAIARKVYEKRKQGYKKKSWARTDKDICSSFLGTSFAICAELWNLINPLVIVSKDATPEHLLWGLLLMKLYSTERAHARLVGGVDEKTFRKWSWLFVHAIASLDKEVVSLKLCCFCVFFV
jgi:hypothetical protein